MAHVLQKHQMRRPLQRSPDNEGSLHSVHLWPSPSEKVYSKVDFCFSSLELLITMYCFPFPVYFYRRIKHHIKENISEKSYWSLKLTRIVRNMASTMPFEMGLVTSVQITNIRKTSILPTVSGSGKASTRQGWLTLFLHFGWRMDYIFSS